MTNELVVGYTRLSQQSDLSIKRQEERIREISDGNDYELDKIYNDGERASGFTLQREEYQKLLNRIRDGDIDGVVVNEPRRLARDYDATLELILNLRRNKIFIDTYDSGKLNLDNPMMASMEILKAAAEYEAKLREIEAAKEAVEEKLERGDDFGKPPIGFTYSDDKREWVPDRGEFPIVLRIIELVEDGYTYTTVLEEIRFDTSVATISRIMNEHYDYIRDTAIRSDEYEWVVCEEVNSDE